MSEQIVGFSRKIDILDHGYIRLVETYGMGDSLIAEAGIVEAARMSTQKGFQGWGPLEIFTCARCGVIQKSEAYPGEGGGWGCYRKGSQFGSDDSRCWGKVEVTTGSGDEKLLRYLYENVHSTPFEFAGAIFEIQAPIFVFREWHRHRTQSYNEMSARYSPLPDTNYIPTVERLMMNGGKNKQAQGTGAELDEVGAKAFQYEIEQVYSFAQGIYEGALRRGVPKELARVVLPVGRYSRMRAHANLRNWLAFITLRSAKNAQWEIRQYSNALAGLLAEVFPRTMKLFLEGSFEIGRFSGSPSMRGES